MRSVKIRRRFLLGAALALLSMALPAGLFLATPCVTAQQVDEGAVKSVTALRITDGSSPRIDGVLDEPFWRKATRTGDFVQYQPDHGSPASESTFVRVAYDDAALYFGMQMYDSEPDKIVSRLTRRDRWVNGDLIHIIVDSHHDHQTAYAFTFYVSGTQRDVYYYNDTWSDDTWDAVWDAQAKITDWGWAAECRIPFHCLRFACEDDPVWGIYFSRSIARKNELSRWVYIPEGASGFVSHFGHLEGLAGLTPPKRLEVLPYGVSYAETEASSLGNPDGRGYRGNAGFDAKYGITSDITLSATINPDFGQVEADETILNLSTFETWYPEKRPFFVEGSKIFETYYTLFYSRRIGRPPAGWPADADYFVDRPTATTILGAVKVSGKTSSGTSIGIMESATQREKGAYIDLDGNERTAVIEPEANFLVARLSKDVLRNSSVGIMATSVNQRGLPPEYTGGLDWNLRFGGENYQFRGQLVGSRTGPTNSGLGGMVMAEKTGGEHFVGSVKAEYIDRGLDLNRLGYLRRPDFKEAWMWLQYRTHDNWWIVRRSWNNLNVGGSENLSGLRLNRSGNFNNMIELANFWTLESGIYADFKNAYSDVETRGGPPAPIPGGQGWWLGCDTDGRKALGAGVHIQRGTSWGGRFGEYRGGLDLRPRSNIEVSLYPGYSHTTGQTRWLAYRQDQSGNRTDEIFGERQVRELNLTLRGTVTFTPRVTLQVYAQPFIAAVDYSHFKKLVPPDGFEYVDSSVYNEAEERPDFNWKSFNSNVIVRWEYRPGSVLYVVWTQGREAMDGIGGFKLDRDLDSLFSATPHNTFLVKLSYWWNV